MKKKMFWVPFFAVYHMFMPFVMVGCGQDVAYEKAADEEAAATVTLEECLDQEVTTEECVPVLQKAQEAEAAAQAAEAE